MSETADSDKPLPRLIPTLETIPIGENGAQRIVLRDTEESAEAMVVSPAGMLLASALDGRRTIADVQQFFTRRTGAPLTEEEVRGFLQQLEAAHFLDTPEVEMVRLKKWQAYKESPVRPAIHAGAGYPSEPEALRGFLDRFFDAPRGPGQPLVKEPVESAPAVGLLAPHIDFHRGGPAYAWAYGALARFPRPDVIIALGVAHASPNSPWVMTRKPYETPFGPMKLDLDLCDAIQERLWYDACGEEQVHRKEHSLEFQAVWLKYLWGENTPPWVPLLTSTFERFSPHAAPSNNDRLEAAIVEIGNVLRQRAERGEKILILGGVDFAHVGPRFGDDLVLGSALEERVRQEDRQSLVHASTLDANSFYVGGVGPHAWRKLCGLSATYTFLRWVKALAPSTAGRLLTEEQASDPLGGLVSFVSMLFT